MDIGAIAGEVAAATGLAEGAAGVADILAAVLAAEPAAVREVSRRAELPVPVVAAVCSELRKRGVIDRARPVRLTGAGRAAVADGQPDLDVACPDCGGRGVLPPAALDGLADDLAAAAAGAPPARMELDQTHCTVPTKIARVLRMHAAHALAGQRILLLGDDDLIAVAIAAFAARAGAALPRLAVIDTDPAVLAWTGKMAARLGAAVDLVEHDLRQPLPAGLAGAFDVVGTDPPYTVAGAELFLSRAVTALVPGPGRHVFFSFGARRPDQTTAVQLAMARMGLAVRALVPNFNEYAGAGILGGTSHLYQLRTAPGATPLIPGPHEGALYTADGRATAVRPYRCAGCRAVHEVGPGGRWTQIAGLQRAGCPDCGGTVFRPLSRAAATGGEAR